MYFVKNKELALSGDHHDKCLTMWTPLLFFLKKAGAECQLCWSVENPLHTSYFDRLKKDERLIRSEGIKVRSVLTDDSFVFRDSSYRVPWASRSEMLQKYDFSSCITVVIRIPFYNNPSLDSWTQRIKNEQPIDPKARCIDLGQEEDDGMIFQVFGLGVDAGPESETGVDTMRSLTSFMLKDGPRVRL